MQLYFLNFFSDFPYLKQHFFLDESLCFVSTPHEWTSYLNFNKTRRKWFSALFLINRHLSRWMEILTFWIFFYSNFSKAGIPWTIHHKTRFGETWISLHLMRLSSRTEWNLRDEEKKRKKSKETWIRCASKLRSHKTWKIKQSENFLTTRYLWYSETLVWKWECYHHMMEKWKVIKDCWHTSKMQIYKTISNGMRTMRLDHPTLSSESLRKWQNKAIKRLTNECKE